MKSLDYFILLVYLLGVLTVALIVARKIKNSHDMFVAGSESPWWVSGLSAYMTMFSSGTFVVWGGIAYQWGLVGVSICMGNGIAALLAARFLAERWKRIGVTTAAEYFQLRFGKKAMRFYTVANLFYKMIVISVALYAVAVMLCALIPLPEGALFRDNLTGHLSVGWAIIGCGALIVGYTIMGGLWAVLMTDVLQFLVLTICVLLVVPLCLTEVGGIEVFLASAPEGFLSPVAADFTWVFLAGWTIIQFASVGGEWAFVQRYLCVPQPKDAVKATYLFGFLYLASALLWMLPPMLYRVIDAGASPEQAYILACQAVLPAGMIGLMVAAMFSATASMVDSQLNVFSGVLTRDIYARLLRVPATDRHLITAGRIVVLILGIALIGGAMAVPAIGGAQQAALSVAALLIGPLMLPTIWGLFSQRIGARAVWLSAGFGFSISAIIKFGFAEGGWLEGWEYPAGMTAWVQSHLRAIETLAAVAVPATVLLMEELLGKATDTGWLRTTAASLEGESRSIPAASTLPMKITGWSLGALALIVTMIAILNEDQRVVLLFFAAAMFGAFVTTLLTNRHDDDSA